MRVTVLKRSLISGVERSARRGRGRRGETRMWPGRRGLRFTSAKLCWVRWKTWSCQLVQLCGRG
jgi:hypothetical protein